MAWRLEEGFTHAFVYSRRTEVLSGIYADDPYLGGARVKGNGAAPEGDADHDDDPVKVSIACAWFRLLMEIEDTQPNADNTKGSVQIKSKGRLSGSSTTSTARPFKRPTWQLATSSPSVSLSAYGGAASTRWLSSRPRTSSLR